VIGGQAGGGNLAMGSTAAASIGVDAAYANINFAAQGGSAAHNNVQPTTTTMKMIRW
jgi:hypothetical protein